MEAAILDQEQQLLEYSLFKNRKGEAVYFMPEVSQCKTVRTKVLCREFDDFQHTSTHLVMKYLRNDST